MTILKDKKNELLVDEFLVKSKNNKFIMGLNQFGNMTAYMAKKEDAAIEYRYWHAQNKDQKKIIDFFDAPNVDPIFKSISDINQAFGATRVNQVVFVPMLSKTFDFEESESYNFDRFDFSSLVTPKVKRTALKLQKKDSKSDKPTDNISEERKSVDDMRKDFEDLKECKGFTPPKIGYKRS